jgi:hypothetical protein
MAARALVSLMAGKSGKGCKIQDTLVESDGTLEEGEEEEVVKEELKEELKDSDDDDVKALDDEAQGKHACFVAKR